MADCNIIPELKIDFTCRQVHHKLLKRTLVYYPSNTNKGIAIKGTNLRVGFEYLQWFR